VLKAKNYGLSSALITFSMDSFVSAATILTAVVRMPCLPCFLILFSSFLYPDPEATALSVCTCPINAALVFVALGVKGWRHSNKQALVCFAPAHDCSHHAVCILNAIY